MSYVVVVLILWKDDIWLKPTYSNMLYLLNYKIRFQVISINVSYCEQKLKTKNLQSKPLLERPQRILRFYWFDNNKPTSMEILTTIIFITKLIKITNTTTFPKRFSLTSSLKFYLFKFQKHYLNVFQYSLSLKNKIKIPPKWAHILLNYKSLRQP